MGWSCFAKGCTSGSRTCKNKVSLFKAPSDADLLDKWRENIPRTDKLLTANDRLCELHFEKHLVIKEWKSEYEGRTIMSIPVRARLAADAVPTIFQGGKKNKVTIDNVKRITTEVTLIDDCITNTDKCEVSGNACSEVEVIVITPDLEITSTFKELQSNIEYIPLPDTSWHAYSHNTVDMKYVKFYTCIPSEKHNMVVHKEVTVSEDLHIKVQILQKLVSTETIIPLNIDVISKCLLNIHNMNVCQGGPTLESFPDVMSESAFIDATEVWRHNKCEMLLDNDDDSLRCKRCKTLRKVFYIHRSRKEKRGDVANLRCRIPRSLVQDSYSKTAILRKVLKAERRSLIRAHQFKVSLIRKLKGSKEKNISPSESSAT